MMDQLKPCPFCGLAAVWKNVQSPRSAEGEWPTRWLGCDSSDCPVRPHTPAMNTSKWIQGRGTIAVNHDAEHVAKWNQRTAP